MPLQEDGVDTEALEETLSKNDAKLFYSVPNFQNPTGITYSEEKRSAVAEKLEGRGAVFIEDNPYGELRFMGRDKPSMRSYLGDDAVLLGSFSKIVSPGIRQGWVCACPEIMEKLIIAKQASDLHSNYLCQRIVHRYLRDNDIEKHITKIREAYGAQRDHMVRMKEEFSRRASASPGRRAGCSSGPPCRRACHPSINALELPVRTGVDHLLFVKPAPPRPKKILWIIGTSLGNRGELLHCI